VQPLKACNGRSTSQAERNMNAYVMIRILLTLFTVAWQNLGLTSHIFIAIVVQHSLIVSYCLYVCKYFRKLFGDRARKLVLQLQHAESMACIGEVGTLSALVDISLTRGIKSP
jgi:hypothetical protein